MRPRVGDEVELKYVLDLRDFEGDPIQEKIVHDYKVIAEDPEVAIVVETMGGVEPNPVYFCKNNVRGWKTCDNFQ